jgi:hypothetical protein
VKRVVAAIAVAIVAALGATAHTYSGMGVAGVAWGTDTCMTGLEFGPTASASVYLCTGD